MARRKRKWRPIGQWLRTARKDAGLTLTELGKLTSVSSSALGRFESDRAVPSFDDVCVIAQQLGWPLLYFATGHERTGNDRLALAAQLSYWGLRDLTLAERVLIGEVRAFEGLVAEAVGDPNPRVLEAIPGLLLRNTFEASELISSAVRYGTLRRIGWLADVAKKIAEEVPREYLQPDVLRRLHTVQAAAAGAKDEPARHEIDYLSPPLTGRSTTKLRDRAWALSPPLSKRWGIACDITLDQFLSRALTVLQAR